MKTSGKLTASVASLKARFDIGRYAAAGNLDAYQWLVQLETRSLTHALADSYDLDFAELVLADPLGKTDQSAAGFVKASWRAVRDLNVLDALRFGGRIQDEDPLTHAQMEAPDAKRSGILEKGLVDYWIGKGEKIECAPVSIDLRQTDATILADFAEWLRLKRDQAIYPKGWPFQTFSPKDFEQWVELQLLGYLDLAILSKILKIKIPQRVIGELC